MELPPNRRWHTAGASAGGGGLPVEDSLPGRRHSLTTAYRQVESPFRLIYQLGGPAMRQHCRRRTGDGATASRWVPNPPAEVPPSLLLERFVLTSAPKVVRVDP